MNAKKIIESQATYRGRWLKLPYRSLEKARRFGWLPIGFSMFPLFFGASWIASVLPMVFRARPAGVGGIDILLAAFAFVGIVPFGFGFKILVLGIAILRDRTYSRLQITSQNLICYESFYGFSFKRKIPSRSIKQLVINQMIDPPERSHINIELNTGSRQTAEIPDFIRQIFPENLMVLGTTIKMGKGILIAYPREILTEVASLISRELKDIDIQPPSSIAFSDTSESQESVSNERVEIIDASKEMKPGQLKQKAISSVGSSELKSISPNEPPAGSQIKVTHQDGTDVYELPPSGWRKTMPLLTFAILWNGFMVSFAIVSIWGNGLNLQVGLWDTVEWTVFALTFGVAGIALAVWAWNSVNRSAMIGINGEQLFIETKTFFRTKWSEFNQSQIYSISVQNSGATVNDSPIQHLLIETEDQTQHGMFAYLSNDELYWLAGRLKKSLNFKLKNRLDIATAFNKDGEILIPKNTRLTINRGMGQTTVEVPAAPLGRRFILAFFSMLTLAIAAGMGWYFLQQGDLQKAVFHVLIGSFIVVLPVTCLIYSFRRWTVVASPERLTITRRWPLGTNAMTFDATEIKRICIETNGIKIGNCPHHQLVIHTHQKKNAVKLMSSWRIKELKYAAAMIYRALKITPTTDST